MNDWDRSIQGGAYVKKKGKNGMTKNRQTFFKKETLKDVLQLKCHAWPERNIRQEVMELFGVRVKLSEFDQSVEKVYYPSYDQNEKLVGFKCKDITKAGENEEYYTIGKVTKKNQLFGAKQARASAKYLVITEGECFTDETEVFTDQGWKKFNDLNKTEKILQIDRNLKGSFVEPLCYVKKNYDGNLISFKNRSYSSLVTENHEMVYYDYKGRLKKTKAKNLRFNCNIPKTMYLDAKGVNLTNDQIALQLAVSADCKIDYRKNGKIYAHFCLKKDRKKERLSNILNRLKIKYTSYPQKKEGYRSFNFTLPDYIKDKKLPEFWLKDMSLIQRRFVLEEQVFWDGNEVPNRNQVEFSSKLYEEALWMHTMCHTAGYSGSIIKRKSNSTLDRFKNHTWYKVSILFNKKTVCTQRSSLHRTIKKYKGEVYCVSVPTGRILIKHNDKISVCGNCDCLSAYQSMVDYFRTFKDWNENLTPAVVTFSAGAVQAVNHLSHNEKFLKKFQEFRLAMDNDEVSAIEKLTSNTIIRGKECTENVGCYLLTNDSEQGKRDIKVVKLGEDYNDISDYVQVHKGIEIAKQITEKKRLENFSAEKIITVEDITIDELLKPKEKGIYIDSFPLFMDKLWGIRKRELSVFTAMSGVGKTVVSSEIAYKIAESTNEKVAMVYLEENSHETLMRMIARRLKINYYKFVFEPLKYCTREQFEEAYNWVNGKFYFLDVFGSMRVSELMNSFRSLYYVSECSYIIFDHLTLLTANSGAKDERRLIDDMMTELATFTSQTDIGILAVSHLSRQSQTEIGKLSDIKESKWINVRKEHLRGSSSLETLAWNVFGLDMLLEPNRERSDVRISVLKNRSIGFLGVADQFHLNQETGLIELTNQQQGY